MGFGSRFFCSSALRPRRGSRELGSLGAGPFVRDPRALSDLTKAPASCYRAEHDPAPAALPSASHRSTWNLALGSYGNFTTGTQGRRGRGTSTGGTAVGEHSVSVMPMGCPRTALLLRPHK